MAIQLLNRIALLVDAAEGYRNLIARGITFEEWCTFCDDNEIGERDSAASGITVGSGTLYVELMSDVWMWVRETRSFKRLDESDDQY